MPSLNRSCRRHPMPEDFASRSELNGFGSRLMETEKDVAVIQEGWRMSERDRTQIWEKIGTLYSRDAELERLINKVSVKVAGISALAVIANAVIVAFIVKGLGH